MIIIIKPNNMMKRILLLSMASLLFVPAGAEIITEQATTSVIVSTSKSNELSSSEKSTAYMYAKELIKKKCKYPSTCVFPKLYNQDAVRFFYENGYHGMGVTFKSENSLGQKCNMKAVVIFEWKNGKPKFVSVDVYQ